MYYELPETVQARIRAELDAGESVRWADQPVPTFFLITSIAPFLFAIPWTAFAFFWICGASGFKIPDFSKGGFSFFPLFGIPFVLIGLYLLSAPLRDYGRMRKMIYVVTNKRAIIIGREVRSFFPKQLENCVRRDRRNDMGDVLFVDLPLAVVLAERQSNSAAVPRGFINVRNPREVERHVRALVAGA